MAPFGLAGLRLALFPALGALLLAFAFVAATNESGEKEKRRKTTAKKKKQTLNTTSCVCVCVGLFVCERSSFGQCFVAAAASSSFFLLPSVPSAWRLDDRARSAVSVTPTILALAAIFDEESERRGDAGGSGAREVTRSDDDPPSSCCYVRTNFSVSGSWGGRQGFVCRARAGYRGRGREGVRFRLKLSCTDALALALFCVRVTVGEAAESEARVIVDLTVRVICGKGEYLKSVGTAAYFARVKS